MTKLRMPHIVLVAMIFMAFFVPVPVAAQNDPVATELVQLPVVATTESGDPVYGVILPTVAPETTPAPSETTTVGTTTTTVINGLLLLVAVLVIALLVLVFLVLRSRAASGDETAQRWLTMLNAGRDNFFPQARTEAWIKAQEDAANQTKDTLLDDAAIALIKAGWQVIAPQQVTTPQAGAVTVSVQPAEVRVDTSGGGAGSAAKSSTPYPPASGHDLGLDLTTGPKPEPTRPASDGGAPTGNTGFPPVR